MGGRAVTPRSVVADFTLGYPYILDVGATTGVWAQGGLGADVRIGLQTFLQFTDISVRGRFQFLGQDPLYLAVEGALGGGGGPNGRNTFFGDLGLGMTMSFAGFVSFSARTWFDFWTDRFCPAADDHETPPRMECVPTMRGDGTIYDPIASRDNGARWYIGAWVDVGIAPHVSFVGGLYGAPFQAERLMFKDQFNDVFLDSTNGGDLKTYGQLGFAVKY
jgi:hypothetical protein